VRRRPALKKRGARRNPGPSLVRFGIDRLLAEKRLRAELAGRRVALLAHPASVTRDIVHSLDALAACKEFELAAAFGPQHGLRGEKQDNMIESDDFHDPRLGIPVFSLYGATRRPTAAMMRAFDVLLVDLQDVGCRIYTWVATLRYVLEEAARHGKSVWVLDRPNPIGREIEGLTLVRGSESFVGEATVPMRHGLTLGEMGRFFIASLGLRLDYRVIKMAGWNPDEAPGYGWPAGRSWINPSPNAANVSMARCFAGTVMVEGTELSEGRGTTRPLELFGAPDIDPHRLRAQMEKLAPGWLDGCRLRECWFEPTFHKHVGQLCGGLQIHVDDAAYAPARFKPWRLVALAFKALKTLDRDYALWRDFPYEYVEDRLAIDALNGGPQLREWVDDPRATVDDLDAAARRDETEWRAAREPFLLYPPV
jgi:uncharacterized protein YbbC (DUF1343 family)